MAWLEKQFLLHDNRLHPCSILQATSDSLGGEWLVGDFSKCSCHLGSSFGLARGDKMCCMLNIGDGKFGRMSSQRLLKGRTMFGAQSRDGAKTKTSRRMDLACCVARIKEGEDVVALGS